MLPRISLVIGGVVFVLLSQGRAQLVINEVVANPDGRAPSIGLKETMVANAPSFSEWIEIKNVSAGTVSLDGYTLTDNDSTPSEWAFPVGIELNAGQCLVVLADGLGKTGDYIHTNFGLSSSGEYLGLYGPGGTVVDEWAPEYPQQFPSHSFGREPGGATLVYLESPSPGEENAGLSYVDYVRTPDFDLAPGFYDEPISVGLLTSTSGAAIHYTLDGSEPTASSPVFSSAIASTAGEVLGIRARAFHPDLVPSRIVSATYLMNQPSALKSLPVISWLGGEGDVFYAPNGIMDQSGNAARDRERVASMEFFLSDNTEYQQLSVGLRVASSVPDPDVFPAEGIWTYPWKRPQFNGFFRGEYGDSKFDSNVFFPWSELTSFDNVRFRSNTNAREPYFLDEFVRRVFINTGNVGSSGSFASLYINGQFKTVVNTAERVREGWLQDVYDSSAAWDVRHVWDWVDGDTEFHTEMKHFFQATSFADDENYAKGLTYLDPVNFSDYLLVLTFMSTDDWPGNNKILARERPSGRFRYYVWDAEQSIGAGHPIEYDMFANELLVNPQTHGGSDIPIYFTRFHENPEFRLLWADRAQKHLFHDGALTSASMDALWGDLRDLLSPVMDYMWGVDYNDPAGQGSRNEARFNNWRDDRAAILLDHMRDHGLWPDTLAPTYSQFGGNVSAGTEITLANPNDAGTIYYTTDGTDPRLPGGAVAPGAVAYGAPIVLSASAQISARILDSGEWSPIETPFFVLDVPPPNIRITELMYNPGALTDAEIAAGITDKQQFEFMELTNVGDSEIDLTDLRLTSGITFDFSTASSVSLAVGGRALLVADPAAFAVRYGAGFPVIGSYMGSKLSNGGEQIVLQLVDGTVIHDFTYDDAWYPSTDGDGFSLEIADETLPVSDWNLAETWKASPRELGTPGLGGAIPGPGSIVINEVLTHTDAAGGDWIELLNTTSRTIDIGGWFLSDDVGTPLKYQIPMGTVLGGGQFVVFDAVNHFGASSSDPGVVIPFGLSESGDEVVLSSALEGELTGYQEDESYVGADRDVTFGRHILSTGEATFTTLETPTQGAANSGPFVGAVVINELHYNPSSGEEYIELYNRSAIRQDLYDPARPENTWRFDDGVNFIFPQGVYLESEEYLLVVPFDPIASPESLSDFLTEYDVPSDVPVYGPYSGSLSNGGELVRLSRPGPPEPFTPSATNLPADGEWVLFRWFGPIGNFNSLDGPYLVDVPNRATAVLDVTDWRQAGDVFDVFNHGEKIGTTSVVAPSMDQAPDAEVGFDDPRWSSGSFELGPGSHSIEIEVIQRHPSFETGGGFMRVTVATEVPYIAEDSVEYDDKSPWPTEPDGEGPSLERVSASVLGDEPTNWRSRIGGSAGRANVDAYEAWLLMHYEAADLADPTLEDTLWGPGVDRDLDGFPLLMEFYMGLNPEIYDDEIELFPGGSVSTITYRKARITGGVRLSIEYSDDEMASWKVLPHTSRVVEDHSTWDRMAADVEVGFDDDDRYFFRLRTTR